jgi:hypothetical protein
MVNSRFIQEQEILNQRSPGFRNTIENQYSTYQDGGYMDEEPQIIEVRKPKKRIMSKKPTYSTDVRANQNTVKEYSDVKVAAKKRHGRRSATP